LNEGGSVWISAKAGILLKNNERLFARDA